MKSLDKQDWEEALWEIIGEVKIPSVLKGHDEMSLFDVCMRGTQDEEGIWLVEKLKSFIQSELDRQIDEILGLEILKEEKIKYGRAGALERNRCDQHEAFHLGEKAGKYYKIEEIKEVINSLKKQ